MQKTEIPLALLGIQSFKLTKASSGFVYNPLVQVSYRSDAGQRETVSDVTTECGILFLTETDDEERAADD